MIELSGLTLETRCLILDHVDYSFLNRRIYGIVAENGGGKTTFFRTLVGLKKAKAGTILFDGNKPDQSLKDVFYFETIEWLDNNLSGENYLKFIKCSWKSNIIISEIIHVCDMDEYIKLPIKKYSLGMKQRLLIAMYIISDAKYMMMDEITSGLDENNRAMFFQQAELMKRKGKTILLSSHYHNEIKSACDIVLQIKDHRLSEVLL